MPLNSASLRSSIPAYLQLVDTRLDASTETINTHVEHVRKVDDTVAQVAAKEDGIVASKVLSDEGKSQALAELATANVSKFSPLARVVSGFAEDLRATKERLYTVKAPTRFGTDAYAYGLEIRQDYKGLNQNERDSAFLIATQSGDDAVIWAMLQSPVPMVTPAILDSALEERARRLNPETVARLHQVDILHESLSGLRDAVAGWLKGLGGDPKKIFDELGGDEPALSPIEVSMRQVQHA